MTLIYAGSFSQFLKYCISRQLKYRKKGNVIYVRSIYNLREIDLSKCRIIFTGTCEERTDYPEIEKFVKKFNGKIVMEKLIDV